LIGVARCGAIAIVLLREIIVPGAAHAQTGFQLTPSLSTTEAYDSNVFFAASNPLADHVTRVTPSLETQYLSRPLTFTGRYTLDAERFADHPDLTAIDDRQNAAVDFLYRPSGRSSLDADASFTRTHTPGELNAQNGFSLTRALAERVRVHPTFTRQLDAITSATVEYSFTEDSLPWLAGGTRLRTHTVSFGAQRRLSTRGTVTARYEAQRFAFGPATVTTSQALIVGWTHDLTRQTGFALSGGPRVTNGSVASDISASIHRRARVLDLSLAGARTRTTLIGLDGTADVESVTGAVRWDASRSLQMRIEPGVFRSAQLGLQSRSYQVAFRASRLLTKELSIVAEYDVSSQHGNVYPTIGFNAISRHTASISVVGARPSNPRSAQPSTDQSSTER
jgi:hypothetical protein